MQTSSDPVYGSNGRGYWLGHSNEHISREEKFNRYLDTLKPQKFELDTDAANTEASLKQAEEMTGKSLTYYDWKNPPPEKKKETYPVPFSTPDPENLDAEEDQEIDDTLDSIRQAEILYGYKKEHRTWHPEGSNWDYYNHYKKSVDEIAEQDAKYAAANAGGPFATQWWKKLTKDNGLNGMDPIPKGRQHGGEDDCSDDESKCKKELWERNQLDNEPWEKHFKKKFPPKKKEEKEEPKKPEEDENKPEKDDGLSEKQKAEASVTSDGRKKEALDNAEAEKSQKKAEGKEPKEPKEPKKEEAKPEQKDDDKEAKDGDAKAAKKPEKKEAKDGDAKKEDAFVPPELMGPMGLFATGMTNGNGMPIHFNDSWDGDQAFTAKSS